MAEFHVAVGYHAGLGRFSPSLAWMSTNEQAPTHQSLRVVGHLQTGCSQRGTHILGREEPHLMMFDAMLCPRWCAN